MRKGFLNGGRSRHLRLEEIIRENRRQVVIGSLPFSASEMVKYSEELRGMGLTPAAWQKHLLVWDVISEKHATELILPLISQLIDFPSTTNHPFCRFRPQDSIQLNVALHGVISEKDPVSTKFKLMLLALIWNVCIIECCQYLRHLKIGSKICRHILAGLEKTINWVLDHSKYTTMYDETIAKINRMTQLDDTSQIECSYEILKPIFLKYGRPIRSCWDQRVYDPRGIKLNCDCWENEVIHAEITPPNKIDLIISLRLLKEGLQINAVADIIDNTEGIGGLQDDILDGVNQLKHLDDFDLYDTDSNESFDMGNW